MEPQFLEAVVVVIVRRCAGIGYFYCQGIRVSKIPTHAKHVPVSNNCRQQLQVFRIVLAVAELNPAKQGPVFCGLVLGLDVSEDELIIYIAGEVLKFDIEIHNVRGKYPLIPTPVREQSNGHLADRIQVGKVWI